MDSCYLPSPSIHPMDVHCGVEWFRWVRPTLMGGAAILSANIPQNDPSDVRLSGIHASVCEVNVNHSGITEVRIR
jgi:hypothetical protein